MIGEQRGNLKVLTAECQTAMDEPGTHCMAIRTMCCGLSLPAFVLFEYEYTVRQAVSVHISGLIADGQTYFAF